MNINDEIKRQIEHITEDYGKTPNRINITFEKYYRLCMELGEPNKQTFIGIPLYVTGAENCGHTGVNVTFDD